MGELNGGRRILATLGFLAFVVGAGAVGRSGGGTPDLWQVGAAALLAGSSVQFFGIEDRVNRSGWRGAFRPKRAGVDTGAPLPATGRTTLHEPVTLAIRRTRPLAMLTGSVIVAALTLPRLVSATSALGEPSGDYPTVISLMILGAAPWALLVAARSTLRLVTGGQALRLADSTLTIGMALGYLPPLPLPRQELAAIESSPNERHLLITTSQGAVHVLPTDRLADGLEAITRLHTAWPEFGRPEPVVTTADDLVFDSRLAAESAEVTSVDKSVSKRAQDRLRLRMIVAFAFVGIGGGVFLLFVLSYFSHRSANDQLLETGTVVSSTVIDFDDGDPLIPALLVVQFDDPLGEISRPIHATIASGPFRLFDRSNLGRTLDIAVDPDHLDRVRLLDQRNYPASLWWRLAVPLMVLLVAWPYGRNQLRGLAWLDRGAWTHQSIRIVKAKKSPARLLIRVIVDGEQGWQQIARVAGTSYKAGTHDAWLCESDDGYVVATTQPEYVFMAHKPNRRRPTGSTTPPAVA